MRIEWIPKAALILGMPSFVYGQSPHAFDRLEPVSPYSIRPEFIDLKKILIREKDPSIWMIADSAFLPAYGIALKQLPNPESRGRGSIFRATLVRLSKPYWVSRGAGANGRKVPNRGKKAGFKIQSIDVPSDASEAILKAWNRGVQEARYRSEISPPPLPHSTYTYEFYAEGGYFGKAWGAEPGMADLMIQLANSIAAFVEADPTDRNARIQGCIEAARRIQEYAFINPPPPNHSMHSDAAATRHRR